MKACNINAQGKALRLVAGILITLAGVILLTLSLLGILPDTWLLYVAGGLILAGGFMIYEGAAGWCLLRAMGFRTPV